MRRQRDRLAWEALNIPNDPTGRGLRRYAQIANAYNNEAIKRGVPKEKFTKGGLYMRTDLGAGRNVVSHRQVQGLQVALSAG